MEPKKVKANGNKDKTDPESNQYEGDYKNDKKRRKRSIQVEIRQYKSNFHRLNSFLIY